MPLCALLLSASLVRDQRPGTERRYRVSVVSEAGDEFAYRLRLKIVGPPKLKPPGPGVAVVNAPAPGTPAPAALIDLLLADYRSTMEGQKIALKTLGAGQNAIDPTGLPAGLDLGGPQGPVFLPLLSLALPGDAEGPFDVPPVDVGSGLRFQGGGTFSRKDRKATVQLDAKIVRGGKDLGKLTIMTELDGGGWPTRSEGTLVSADGTYHFKLDRA